MPSRSTFVTHTINGGWATDFNPLLTAAPDEAGYVSIPYLADAGNIEYLLAGGVRKIGGTTRVNAADISSSTTTITGLYDYWRQGTAGTPTRRRVCHAGTQIYADTDDTVFNSIATGLESAAIPQYSQFDDFLIIGSSATADVPRSWDQTTFQNLAGSPPNFSFSVPHKNKQWAAGVAAAPSTLYFSVTLDPEDWTGVGSGSISIDPNDGDSIVGIMSFRNELIVWKGPYKGSIHRITGSSSSDFARTTYIRGLGGVWQNSMVPYGSDVAWIAPTGTIHSLAATDQFGDYNQAYLSQPIDSWIRDNINKPRLKFAWGVNDTLNGRLLFGLSRTAVQSNDFMLVYDYRFQPGRWAYYNAYPSASLGYFVDGGGQHRRAYVGGTNGRIRRINMPMRSIDGSTAYTARVTTPYLNYGSSVRVKTIGAVGIGFTPTGDYNTTVGFSRDGKAQQTATVSMIGGDVLATAPAGATDFTLDSSVLGGALQVSRYTRVETGGEFRAIQYQITQGGADQEMEVYDFTAHINAEGMALEALN